MTKGLTSFSTCTSLSMAWQATRELFYTFLAGLGLTASGTGLALFGVPSELHRGVVHLALLPVPCGVKCPARASLLCTCDQPRTGNPSHACSPSHTWEPIPQPLQAALRDSQMSSVTGNICWIRDTGEFCVLSHWRWSGMQS